MADELQPTRTISSLVPTSEQSLDPAIYHDPTALASNEPVAGVSVAPVLGVSLQHQAAFEEASQKAAITTKIAPIEAEISRIEEKIAQNAEDRGRSFQENKAEYDRAKAEAEALKKSQEGLEGGEYRTLNVGYDTYLADLKTQERSYQNAKNELLLAEQTQDTARLDTAIQTIRDESKKLSQLSKIDPFTSEKYPMRTITSKFLTGIQYASGYGQGGFAGFGAEGAKRADILLGQATGGTVGASTSETRAAAALKAAADAASKGVKTPEITQDYVSDVVARFNKNPFSEDLSQTDRLIASTFTQLSDPTSKYSSAGLASIASHLVEAGGLTPAQAVAIVSTSPQAQGSSSYNAILNLVNSQKIAQENLRAQIITQEEAAKVKPVISAPISVAGLGETGIKRPFVSTLAIPTTTRETKPEDAFSRISDFISGTPLISALRGKEPSPESRKIQDVLAIASPALGVSGGGTPKLPAGAKVPTIFESLFGVKSGVGDIIKGISTAAIIPGSLASKGDKTANASYVNATAPRELTMKERSEVHPSEGLFGTKFYLSQLQRPSEVEKTQLPGALKGLSTEDLMGGGKNRQSYADLMSTYSDVKTASKITTPSKETFYLIVGDKGNFQLRESGTGIGMERVSADQGAGAFDQLLNKNVDLLATTMARERGSTPDITIHFGEKGSLYGSKQDFLNSLQKGSIDLNNPIEIQKFAEISQQKAKSMTALQVAQNEAYQQVLIHRVEKEKNLPMGSLSVQDYLKMGTSEKPTIGDTVQTINKAINPIGASAYEGVRLNETNPYSGLQFATPKSEKVAGILSSLDGSPLTPTQRDVIMKEGKSLPIEDKIVLDKFVQTYEGQNSSYSNLTKSFENYDYTDASRSNVLNQIKEYSNYDPSGAKLFLQTLKDTDTAKTISDKNIDVVNASASASPYNFNMILKGGKLVPSEGGRDKLSSTIAEQQAEISKIQTPSIREQMQNSLKDAVVFGEVNRELKSPDLSGTRDFNKLVDSLNLVPADQKANLKTQYVNYAEAKNLSDKADTLIQNAPKTGISDKELSDLKAQLNKNPVLSSVNEKTGKTYNDDIITGLEKVKKGYWSEEDYRKEVSYDFITGAGLSLRASGQASVEKEGANPFNVGKSFVGGLIAAPGTTIYGTIKSTLPMFGMEGAQETTQQSKETKAVMPTFGGIFGLGDTVASPYVSPYTKPLVPYARGAGSFVAANTAGLIYDIGASAIEGRKIGSLGTGGREYAGALGGEFLASPLEKPVSAVATYGIGFGIGKIFSAISEAKTGLLIAPRLERNAAKLAEINAKLAATEGGAVRAGETAIPKATRLNPLARGGVEVAESGAAERQALFAQESAINRSTRLLKASDTGIDLAIGAPFIASLALDLTSTISDPTATGAKLSNLAIMGAGAENLLGKQTIMGAKIGEAGAGGSAYTSEAIGLKTRMPLSEVESFTPLLSIVKSPTEGVRLPFTSKEVGYSIKLGTPSVMSEVRDIQPARRTMSASDEAFYQQLVKDLAPDARAKAEIPALSKLGKTKKTDALIEETLKELKNVDKTKYSKLPSGELELIGELSARYKEIGDFSDTKGITPSGKEVPVGVNSGILSAELIRSGKLPEVGRLSPLGKQLLYETVLDANLGKAETPLARTLVNATDKIEGRKPTYGREDINLLPTNAERIFGEARLKTMNPFEARIIEKAFREKEARITVKSELETLRLDKRIAERTVTINKLENEVLRTGKAQLTRSDIRYLDIDIKPAEDGKFYIDAGQFDMIKRQISNEEQQLVFLSQNKELAQTFDFNKYISQEVKDFEVKPTQNETLFLVDQFGENVKSTYTSGPGFIQLTGIDKIIKGKASEKQFVRGEFHTHPVTKGPISPADIAQLYKNPSLFPLLELTGVKVAGQKGEAGILHVMTAPRNLKNPAQRLSWTTQQVENFVFGYQTAINKIHKTFGKEEPQILSQYQNAIYTESFKGGLHYFKLEQMKLGEPFKVSAEHYTRINHEIANSLQRLQNLERVKGRSVVGGTFEGIPEIQAATRRPTSAVKTIEGGLAEKPKEGAAPRDAFFRSDITSRPTSAEAKTRGEAQEIASALTRSNKADAYLKKWWGDKAEEVAKRPESEKIRLERQLQKDTSGVQLDHTKHIEPSIKSMLDERKVPNSDKVAKEIMKELENRDAVLYGSLIQDATLRLAKDEGLAYTPPITRTARDIDAHLTNPNIAAYKFADVINRAAGDKVVEVREGNPSFTKKYDREQSKLFDLHDINAPEIGGAEGQYIGRGMVQPSRLTMVRKPFIMEGGSLKSITLSEQASRKFEGTGVITPTKTRSLATEEGVTVTGSMIPEHAGRIKDIGDAYQIKQFQADLLEARGNPLKAEKVRTESEKWLSLYGESVARDAHKKSSEAKYQFLQDLGYSIKKNKVNVPSPKIISVSPAPSPAQKKYVPAQKTSLKITSPSKYISQGYKTPSPRISASKSIAKSAFVGVYSPSIAKSSISPSISMIRSPPSPSIKSPSPSPSISSRFSSPSVSPSPSPYKSPSPSVYRSGYSSPSYSYSFETTFKTPPFLLGGLGGGGGGDEKRRRKIRRFGIRAPIATGYQILTGKGLPDFTFNTANIAGAKQTTGINKDLLKRLRKGANA